MVDIPAGYAFLDRFDHPDLYDFFRASRIRDNRPVLIKSAPIRHPRHGEAPFRQLLREYEFCASDGIPGIVQALELIRFGEHAALVLRDEGGRPLGRLLKTGSLGVEQSLVVATQLAETLHALHHNGLIHQSIRPSNILVDPLSLSTRVTGLGMATRVPRSWPTDYATADLEDELAFLSPEKTGRTNRLVDYRTDFYSLGVTLYRMVTGQLPFHAVDHLDLVHAHLAMDPPYPTVLSPNVPHSVSKVILKLMSKEAEFRYQGALGLRADLTQCLQELRRKGEASPFTPGRHDIPDRFELPQKLYGRDGEIRKLTQGFEAACGGQPRVFLVSGASGVGKTSLIHEFGRTVFLRRGCFASGRYELQERAIPYSGILEAARNLVRRLLGESPARLEPLRQKLNDALGFNMGVLVDVIPELEAITGACRQTTPVGPAEARYRFQTCMLQFFEICARAVPLVLFLDDLQRADQPSLELIEGLLSQRTAPYLVVGSCRDNEMGGNHPLMLMLEKLKARGLQLETVTLLPLAKQDILRLAADTLRAEEERADVLAGLIFRKTAGNPFFVKSFMASLHAKRLLKYLPENGWTWNIEKIAEMEATDNVIEFTARNIAALPAKVRDTIAMAAALGRSFESQTIAELRRLPLEEIRSHLVQGCRERILVKRESHFEFEHERIRESAYALIPEKARAKTNLEIGRLLSSRQDAVTDDSRLFEIVGHMNSALQLLEDRAERIRVANLNQRAGRKARSGGAFQAAFRYFSAALSLLDDEAWEDHYPVALEIHSDAAEAAFLSANFEAADSLIDIVHRRARTVLDRISVYETQIAAAHARRREGESLSIMLDVLKLLGIEIPVNPSEEDVATAIRDVHDAAKTMLSGSHQPNSLTDPAWLAATRLLVRAALSAGWTNLPMYWVIAGKIVDLTVRYGYGPEAPVAHVIAGSLIASFHEEHAEASAIGSKGLSLCEELPSTQWRALCRYLFTLDIASHSEPFRSLFDGFAEAHRIAVEDGDVITASTSAYIQCLVGLHMGMELQAMEKLLRTYQEEATVFGPGRAGAGLRQLHEAVLFLMNADGNWETPAAGRDVPPPDLNLRMWHENADQTPRELTYGNQMMLRYLFRESAAARELARLADTLPEGGAASILPSDHSICLCLLDVRSGAAKDEKEQIGKAIAPRIERLKRLAAAAPANYEHKLDLVVAEKLRVLGCPLEAMPFYDRAIDGARRHGYVAEEALADELAAEFHLSLGNVAIATMYLQHAVSAFERWGARRKVSQLHERYQVFLSHPLEAAPGLAKGDSPDRQAFSPRSFDTESLEKTAAALAGELDLRQLIRKLMAILLQNTGAQRGFLLREEEGRSVIMAYGSVEDEGADVLRRDRLDSCEEISHTIVRYVQRSHGTIVTGDARRDGRFSGDPYIERRKPLSILCTPILHRGSAMAILYLENNRMCDVFVGDRLAAIHFISSQAAAALENAQLHENLMREVVVRRNTEEELRKALAEVAQLRDRLEAENLYLRGELHDSNVFKELVGSSRALKEVLHKCEQVASTGTTVLILGETGTGKELVAREIHNRSLRSDRPLVNVNCAALPGPLIESELFGHEKGAFTGAASRKIGRFELADGGTIFLDEIGDLPLDLQAKLLRVLQEGEFERLGASRTLKVDVRVIAATNRDLKSAAERGTFRSDLFYRLSVFPVQLPPLRERREDVPLLVRHFLRKKQTLVDRKIDKISTRVMDRLTAYHWPGNVRELENVVERAMILSPGPHLELEELSFNASGGLGGAAPDPAPKSLEEAERAHILDVLERCGWKIKGEGNAASRLGLNPSTLYFRMKKLNIQRPVGSG